MLRLEQTQKIKLSPYATLTKGNAMKNISTKVTTCVDNKTSKVTN